MKVQLIEHADIDILKIPFTNWRFVALKKLRETHCIGSSSLEETRRLRAVSSF
jgi:hypothetical protein